MSSPSIWGSTNLSSPWPAASPSSSWDSQWSQRYEGNSHTPFLWVKYIPDTFRGHVLETEQRFGSFKTIKSHPNPLVWKHGGAEENVKLRLISGIFCVLNRMGCTCCSWWTRLQPLTRWSLLPFLSWWEFHTFMVSHSDVFTFMPPGGVCLWCEIRLFNVKIWTLSLLSETNISGIWDSDLLVQQKTSE